MAVTIILGAQWGDEGKGKLTDYLLSSDKFQVCARAGGGHNAGHSIRVNDVTYKFHLLPSGLMDPVTENLIGSGVAFNIAAFFKEIEDLEAKGILRVRDRIRVSSRCHLNLELHAAVDGLAEIGLGSNPLGTTKRGIGPTYSSKAARDGLRIADLFHDEFPAKMRALAEGYYARYGPGLRKQYSVEDEIARCLAYRQQLDPYIVDAVQYMDSAQSHRQSILVEGAQALMLDIDYGTYPYVTSSHTTLGGCIQGLALNPARIKEIIGVVKAYTTRVGSGPFPTEDTGPVGEKLQKVGREVGVSTGRPRRCGYLDLVALRYSVAVNHYTAINLTKLDVLDTFEKIPYVRGYTAPGGRAVGSFPADNSLLEKCKPQIEYHPGWNASTKGIKRWDDLPEAARNYVEMIESSLKVPIVWIGTGQDRDAMIHRENAKALMSGKLLWKPS